MKAKKLSESHSDQGPSSKDWEPSRPGEAAKAAYGHGSEGRRTKEVQPGTAQKGKSWHSQRPDPEDDEDKLEEALKDSFPASDPPQPAQPGVTGWDVPEEKEKKAGKV